MISEKLLLVQNKEIELLRLKSKLNELLEEKQRKEKELEKLENSVRAAKNKLEEKKKELKEVKNFISYKKGRIKELKEKKNNLKSRSEYKKLLRDIAKNEDEIIKASQQLAGIEAEIEALKEAYSKVKNDTNPKIKNLHEEIEEIETEIASLTERVKEASQEIETLKKELPEREIELYNRLKEKFTGLVFSDISSGSCEGCGITYSSAEFKELLRKLKPGETKCPYCGRYVYLKKKQNCR